MLTTHRGPFLCCAILLVASLAANAQTIVRSFDGDTGVELAACDEQKAHCKRYPEADVAVNGKHVVQVTRQSVLVYDYGGKLVRSTPLGEFVRNAGVELAPTGKGPVQPHIVFNEFLDRWIFSASCKNDCLLVSESADPMGKWGGISVTCLEGGPCLDGNLAGHIGYDRNGLYYCASHVGDPSDCFAIAAADVGPIAQRKAPAHINRQHKMPMEVYPAIDHDPRKAATAPAFFMAKTCGSEGRTPRENETGFCLNAVNSSFDWLVETFTWEGAGGTYSEQRVKTDVGSKRNKWLYNAPCCGDRQAVAQAGTDLPLRTGGSHRLNNLVQHGTKLYAAMGSGPCKSDCGAHGIDTNHIALYVEMDCANPAACVVSQTAKLSGDDFAPLSATVGVDRDGNVAIMAASFTPQTNLSVLLWTRRKTDPPNTFRGPTTVVKGTQPYTCPPADKVTLIGSSVGVLTALDPLDTTKLWTTQQWAGNAKTCAWNTRIVQYQVDM
jgi:hypothetical protein